MTDNTGALPPLPERAKKLALFLEGIFVSEELSAVKAREIAKCLREMSAALAQRQHVLHKNWSQWAESKGLLPETVAYEAMRLAFEAGALTTAPSAQAEPVAWCALTPSGKIAHFDGKPMVMVGPVGNEHHTTPLYAAPPAAQAEPVAWRIRIGDSDVWGYCDSESDADFQGRRSGLRYVKQAVYAAPPTAQAEPLVPLTMNQANEVARDAQIAFCLDKFSSFDLALIRMTERAHGIGKQEGK